MREVVIVSAVRTPIGKYGNAFKGIPAVELGAIVIKEAIHRAGINLENIDEVIFGNVIQAGLGQNVARQAAIKAGIPVKVPSFTVNKVCGSALRAVSLAAQVIKSEDADIVVAGGMESMSNAPYVAETTRWGSKKGDTELIDTMIRAGLGDALNDYHMGITEENIEERWNISRWEQDNLVLKSQQKAEEAIKSGRFKNEIVLVTVKSKKADIIVDTDEQPSFATSIEKLQRLKSAFIKGGTVTAGNSSGLSDGAAALVIMSAEKAKELEITSLARILSYASARVEPEIMGYGSYYASKRALEKGHLNVDDLDLIESNEAFIAQSIAVAKDMNFDMDKVNVNGGAVALGHPIGASGARILITLLYEMKKRGSK